MNKKITKVFVWIALIAMLIGIVATIFGPLL